jgi:DNA polymerase III alpha subunit
MIASKWPVWSESVTMPSLLPVLVRRPMADRLKREYDAVGFFLSGHPLDEYGDLLQKLRVRRAGGRRGRSRPRRTRA